MKNEKILKKMLKEDLKEFFSIFNHKNYDEKFTYTLHSKPNTKEMIELVKKTNILFDKIEYDYQKIFKEYHTFLQLLLLFLVEYRNEYAKHKGNLSGFKIIHRNQTFENKIYIKVKRKKITTKTILNIIFKEYKKALKRYDTGINNYNLYILGITKKELVEYVVTDIKTEIDFGKKRYFYTIKPTSIKVKDVWEKQFILN